MNGPACCNACAAEFSFLADSTGVLILIKSDGAGSLPNSRVNHLMASFEISLVQQFIELPYASFQRSQPVLCLGTQVDASFQNESLVTVSRASSAMSFTTNWNDSVRFGVRPLDFRDHIAVRRLLLGGSGIR